MADHLTPLVASKLRQMLLLMLRTDKDGETVATKHATNRTLQTAGSDGHEFAARVEHANAKIGQADMQRIFDAGYEAGVRDTDNRNGSNGFHDLDDSSTWQMMARHCRQCSDKLCSSEVKFIQSISSQLEWREPSPKQAKWLKSIFYKTGGRL
jgi:hypothetical protein